MPLTAAITSDGRGAGPGWVEMTYTETVSGAVYTRMPRLAPGVDAQALADSLIPQLEAEYARGELAEAFKLMTEGIDPHTHTWAWVSAEDINQYCVRSAANLMRSNERELFEAINCEDMFDAWGWSNAKVLSYLVGANTGQVNGWRNFISGQSTALSTYVNGVPEQTP